MAAAAIAPPATAIARAATIRLFPAMTSSRTFNTGLDLDVTIQVVVDFTWPPPDSPAQKPFEHRIGRSALSLSPPK
jgi:hypothetical protein